MLSAVLSQLSGTTDAVTCLMSSSQQVDIHEIAIKLKMKTSNTFQDIMEQGCNQN